MTESLELLSGSGQTRLSTCAELNWEPVGWKAAGRLDWSLVADWPLARRLLLGLMVLGCCRAVQSAVQESFLKEIKKFLGPPPVHLPAVPLSLPVFSQNPSATLGRWETVPLPHPKVSQIPSATMRTDPPLLPASRTGGGFLGRGIL